MTSVKGHYSESVSDSEGDDEDLEHLVKDISRTGALPQAVTKDVVESLDRYEVKPFVRFLDQIMTAINASDIDGALAILDAYLDTNNGKISGVVLSLLYQVLSDCRPANHLRPKHDRQLLRNWTVEQVRANYDDMVGHLNEYGAAGSILLGMLAAASDNAPAALVHYETAAAAAATPPAGNKILGSFLYASALMCAAAAPAAAPTAGEKIKSQLIIKYLTEAADAGNAQACLVLGMCHAQGCHTAKDMQAAVMFLRKGMALGSIRCGYHLDNVAVAVSATTATPIPMTKEMSDIYRQQVEADMNRIIPQPISKSKSTNPEPRKEGGVGATAPTDYTGLLIKATLVSGVVLAGVGMYYYGPMIVQKLGELVGYYPAQRSTLQSLMDGVSSMSFGAYDKVIVSMKKWGILNKTSGEIAKENAAAAIALVQQWCVSIVKIARGSINGFVKSEEWLLFGSQSWFKTTLAAIYPTCSKAMAKTLGEAFAGLCSMVAGYGLWNAFKAIRSVGPQRCILMGEGRRPMSEVGKKEEEDDKDIQYNAQGVRLMLCK